MSDASQWYVVKQSDGHCDIVPASELPSEQLTQTTNPSSETQDHWGPFQSEGEAIARRVGLIRAGKCQPV